MTYIISEQTKHSDNIDDILRLDVAHEDSGDVEA